MLDSTHAWIPFAPVRPLSEMSHWRQVCSLKVLLLNCGIEAHLATKSRITKTHAIKGAATKCMVRDVEVLYVEPRLFPPREGSAR